MILLHIELFRYHIGYWYVGISANFLPYWYRPILFEICTDDDIKEKKEKKNEEF